MTSEAGRVAGSIAPDEETAHGVVDEVMPEEFEWERLVRDYPLPALALALAGGFWLGRSRGRVISGAIASWAASQLVEHVNELLGDEVL